MKKILYFASIMLFAVGIKASPLVEVDYQENIYSNRIGNTLYSGQMAFIYLDGHIAYCLDPFEIVGKTYFEDQDRLNKITSYDLEYFELVAYFGYDPVYRNSIYYYMAAQELIWNRIIGGANTYWTTEDNGKGDRISIDSYKKQISDNIDNFYKLPSFNKKSFSAPIYDTIRILDDNKVLGNYSMESYGSNFVSFYSTVNDIGIEVKFNEYGKTKINYERTLITDNKTIVYTGRGNQTLAVFGINRSQKGSIDIEGTGPYSTNVYLKFYDKETNERIIPEKFKVCKNDGEKLELQWINNHGIYNYVEKLKEGTYNLCEVPNGYVDNDINFEINGDDLTEDTYIDLYLEKFESNDITDEIEKSDDVISPIEPNEKEDSTDSDEEDSIESDNNESITEDDLINNKPIINENDILNKEENLGNKLEIKDNYIDTKDDILNELPNTSNYNYFKYKILYSLLIIGVILLVKENWF